MTLPYYPWVHRRSAARLAQGISDSGHTTYMISHSLGAMPERTRARMQEYTDTWAERGIRAWEEGWWMMPVTVGDLIGRIIGAGEGEVVMQQNVSICQSSSRRASIGARGATSWSPTA